MRDSLLFLAIKSMEPSKKKYYDALLFIVNNHLLFVTDIKYKNLMKNCRLSTYFYLRIFARYRIFLNICKSYDYRLTQL